MSCFFIAKNKQSSSVTYQFCICLALFSFSTVVLCYRSSFKKFCNYFEVIFCSTYTSAENNIKWRWHANLTAMQWENFAHQLWQGSSTDLQQIKKWFEPEGLLPCLDCLSTKTPKVYSLFYNTDNGYFPKSFFLKFYIFCYCYLFIHPVYSLCALIFYVSVNYFSTQNVHVFFLFFFLTNCTNFFSSNCRLNAKIHRLNFMLINKGIYLA